MLDFAPQLCCNLFGNDILEIIRLLKTPKFLESIFNFFKINFSGLIITHHVQESRFCCDCSTYLVLLRIFFCSAFYPIYELITNNCICGIRTPRGPTVAIFNFANELKMAAKLELVLAFSRLKISVELLQ